MYIRFDPAITCFKAQRRSVITTLDMRNGESFFSRCSESRMRSQLVVQKAALQEPLIRHGLLYIMAVARV
jgi:hypothetical protein